MSHFNKMCSLFIYMSIFGFYFIHCSECRVNKTQEFTKPENEENVVLVYDRQWDNSTIRLYSGSRKHEGLAQVKLDGEWVNVCWEQLESNRDRKPYKDSICHKHHNTMDIQYYPAGTIDTTVHNDITLLYLKCTREGKCYAYRNSPKDKKCKDNHVAEICCSTDGPAKEGAYVTDCRQNLTEWHPCHSNKEPMTYEHAFYVQITNQNASILTWTRSTFIKVDPGKHCDSLNNNITTIGPSTSTNTIEACMEHCLKSAKPIIAVGLKNNICSCYGNVLNGVNDTDVSIYCNTTDVFIINDNDNHTINSTHCIAMKISSRSFQVENCSRLFPTLCSTHPCKPNPCGRDGECIHTNYTGYVCRCPDKVYGKMCLNDTRTIYISDHGVHNDDTTATTTTGQMSWITIVVVILSLLAGFGICGTLGIIWYRRTAARRLTVAYTKDDIPVLSNNQNDETEQETVEMAVLGERGETNVQNRSIDRFEDNDEWQFVGEQIYYNPKKVIGKGLKAVVYEGRYGHSKIKKIAVKSILCTDLKEAEEYRSEINNVYREIVMIEKLTQPCRNPNIVDFIHSFIDINMLYIAFELGKGTLVDYVKESNAFWRKTLKCLDVNRGISEGLRYIHEKDIAHRDLKPANIFIVVSSCDNLKAVLGDFGTAKQTSAGSLFSYTGSMGSVGYIAPEVWTALSQDASETLSSQCNKKSDIFSAAILFYYTLSLGDHPFGNEMTAQDSIQKGVTPLYTNNNFQLDRNSYAHQSLIECMLKSNPEDRLTAVEVCSHPANWTEHQIMDFFTKKSDEFEIRVKGDATSTAILEDTGLIPTGNWMNNLPVSTREYLKNYQVNKYSSKLYSGKETNVRALLRAIRNTTSHYKNYPPNVQRELGDYPEGHVNMWLRVCPRFLMHVIKILGPP